MNDEIDYTTMRLPENTTARGILAGLFILATSTIANLGIYTWLSASDGLVWESRGWIAAGGMSLSYIVFTALALWVFFHKKTESDTRVERDRKT